MAPSVSIIMRSKNEMPYVRAALNMLTRQSFHDFELFAVDSGSTDGSVELLRTHCPNDRLVEIAPEDYAPGKVLNSAIARTHHPITVLLNADAIPCSEDWLENLIAPLIANEADATFCRQIARPDARFVVAYDYERAYGGSKMESGFFSAVACAFRRDLWQRIPFRAYGYAEDQAWAESILEGGARIQYVPVATVEHSHNYSIVALYRKRYRQALMFDQKANAGRQAYRCSREIVRDFAHACRKLKLHTIPYNLSYRMAIHRGQHCGFKDGAAARKEAGLAQP